MPILESNSDLFETHLEEEFNGEKPPTSVSRLAQAVAAYKRTDSAEILKEIGQAIRALEDKDPDAAERLGADFMAELRAQTNEKLKAAGLPPIPPVFRRTFMHIAKDSEKTPINRHVQVLKKVARTAQEVGTAGAPAASAGAQAAGAAAFAAPQSALLTTAGVPQLVAGGVALTGGSVATGGLLPAAILGVSLLGAAGVSGVATYKTICKRHSLKSLHRKRHTEFRRCNPILAKDRVVGEHDFIADHILPYIIRKKTRKAIVRGVRTVPVIGQLGSVYSGVKKAGKYFGGTLGKRRKEYAKILARHFITHDCDLCFAIISVLFGDDSKAFWLRDQKFEVVYEALLPKMKSN